MRVLVSLITLVYLVSGGTGSARAQTVAAAGGCSAHLSGEVHGAIIPPYLVWSEIFMALEGLSDAATVSGVLASLPLQGRNVATQRAGVALQRVRQIKTERSDNMATDIQQAEVVMEARDDLIRTLDSSSFDILERAGAAALPSITVVSRPIGHIQERAGVRECQVIVRGRDYPHLIPETDYWRLYFISLTAAARSFRNPDGTYSEEHLKAVHSTLQISYDQISRVLELSRDVTTDLQSISSSSATQGLADKIVMDARSQLLRSVPEIVWLQIKQDAERARYGMRVSYLTK